VVIAAGRPDWRRRDADNLPKADLGLADCIQSHRRRQPSNAPSPRVGTTRSYLVPCAWPSNQLWWSPTPRC